jgi:predicted RNase H-like HicB family nuclease
MTPRYTMIIRWSDEDQLYLVAFPELTGPDRPQTHGRDYVEAARMGDEVLALLIETFHATGRALPDPITFESVKTG